MIVMHVKFLQVEVGGHSCHACNFVLACYSYQHQYSM